MWRFVALVLAYPVGSASKWPEMIEGVDDLVYVGETDEQPRQEGRVPILYTEKRRGDPVKE